MKVRLKNSTKVKVKVTLSYEEAVTLHAILSQLDTVIINRAYDSNGEGFTVDDISSPNAHPVVTSDKLSHKLEVALSLADLIDRTIQRIQGEPTQ